LNKIGANLMKMPETAQVAIIWFLFIGIATLAIFWSPISNILFYLTNEKIYAVFILVTPGILVIFLYNGVILFNLSSNNKKYTSGSWQMSALIFYCLLLVLFTGGISKSPLSPLIAIVPLISGPYYNTTDRKKILFSYLFGLLLVCGLSYLNSFQPPESYPKTWLLTGRFDNIIVTSFLFFGIIIELLIIKLNEGGERVKTAT